MSAIHDVRNIAEGDYTEPSWLQVLGYPRQWQNEVTGGQMDCRPRDVSCAEWVEKAGQWILLLQCKAISGDFALFIMIRKADLAARRFDRIGWEVQTT
jgi:hypothetical protein